MGPKRRVQFALEVLEMPLSCKQAVVTTLSHLCLADLERSYSDVRAAQVAE